jgi:hypothetical protein
MKTAKVIADKMVADTAANVYIYFDTVETFQGENGVAETNDHTFVTSAVVTNVPTYASQPQETVVAHRGASTAVAGKAAIAAKRSFLVAGTDSTTAMGTLAITANAAVLHPAPPADISSANDNVNVAAILSAVALANADAAGVTLTATAGARPSVTIEFSTNDSTDENSATTTVGPAGFVTTVSDTFTLTIAGDKAGAVSVATTGATAIADFVTAISDAWAAANPTAGLTQWDIATSSSEIQFTAKDAGTAQIGALLTLGSSVASTTNTNFGYKIYNGYDGNITNAITGDNGAKGDAIVVTIEADTAGTSLSEVGQISAAAGVLARSLTVTAGGAGTTATELTNTYRNNLTLSTTTDKYTAVNEFPTQNRSDVRAAEDLIGGSTNTATSFDRTGWLAD